MTLKRLAVSLCLLFFPVSAHSQQAAVQNPQAVTLAMQAMSALTGTTQINDVTLTGTATRTAGSDIESGSITLKALGTADGRLDLSLTNGTRTEIRNSSNGVPQGFWIGLDATVHSMANQNCFTDAVWFFPASTVLSQVSNPNLAISYVGQETRNGLAVQHIRFSMQFPTVSSDIANSMTLLTVTDIYLDSTSSLPVAVLFNAHPDTDAGTNIPIEVDFSNYQLVQGAQIPFRIQKLMNGTLFLDLTIQAAVLNSGLNSSAFSLN
jgi:hypothetical protein